MCAADFQTRSRALRQLIDSTPIIDNHAHPLLKKSHIDDYPLLAIATEAHGDALGSSRTSLAHIRAVKQLSQELGCAETWEEVEGAIGKKRASDAAYERWTQRCLSGIECVLVDDGLDNEDAVESYSYFDRFAPSASKRIVRVEQMAASLIDNACVTQPTADQAFELAVSEFEAALKAAIADDQVVAFKSVICYRSGLDIASKEDCIEALAAFESIYATRKAPNATRFTRLDHRPLNQFLLHRLAQAIRASGSDKKKPIQFHTGLGDNDLTLTRASPAHLQEFVRAYPTVPVVLLHSGYPFDREAGYMAAMYASVYADIGEVFPFVNRDGQENIVRHVLELCPWEKIIWSTDGHWFPETYYLSIVQMREVFHTVLCGFVQKGDISWAQASKMVEDILFNTANKIYHLGLLTLNRQANPGLRRAHTNDDAISISPSKKQLLEALRRAETPHYLRACWIDYTGTTRLRLIPVRKALSVLGSGEPLTIGVTKAALAILQNDTIIPDADPSGEYKLHPDFSSFKQGVKPGHSMIMCDFREKDGGSGVNLCPRAMLKTAVERASKEQVHLKLGFEIELALVRYSQDEKKYKLSGADGQGWSTARAADHEVVEKILEPAVERLDAAGVYVEMLHAESARGQYEIVLPPASPLEAVDTLVFAREVISACASTHGYRVTLHPKPIAEACGTAAHAHMSLCSLPSGGAVDQTVYESFYAGILAHLRAICAFTHSNLVSYERVQDGAWAGGTWVAWGTQNRETPLRKIADSHWEIRCIDGLANPYLAVAALMTAGANGVATREKLVWGDCTKDPATLFWEERLNLGINSNLPANIEDALVCLVKDEELVNLMGRDLVQRYIAVKKAETKLLKEMEVDARQKWIIDRY